MVFRRPALRRKAVCHRERDTRQSSESIQEFVTPSQLSQSRTGKLKSHRDAEFFPDARQFH
jgi:hypothetical protein